MKHLQSTYWEFWLSCKKLFLVKEDMYLVASIFFHKKCFFFQHAFSGSFNFSDAVTLCERCYETIKVVFSSSADQIMAKFVLSLYHLKLQEYIDKILESNQSLYLDNLMMLYTK